MIEKHKTNRTLGLKVKKHLQGLGLETPMIDDGSTQLFKLKTIADSFKTIMETMNLNLTDDSLQDTPNRVAKMFVQETFSGLDYDNFPKISSFEKPATHDGSFVLVRNLTVHSFCEHHFVPFTGFATIAYVPSKKIVGLSKLNRVVNFFSRRPQVQERLCEQIKEALKVVLETEDVAVYINADHLCVKLRGVQDQNSSTDTLAMSGTFADKDDDGARREFLAYIHDMRRK